MWKNKENIDRICSFVHVEVKLKVAVRGLKALSAGFEQVWTVLKRHRQRDKSLCAKNYKILFGREKQDKKFGTSSVGAAVRRRDVELELFERVTLQQFKVNLKKELKDSETCERYSRANLISGNYSVLSEVSSFLPLGFGVFL